MERHRHRDRLSERRRGKETESERERKSMIDENSCLYSKEGKTSCDLFFFFCLCFTETRPVQQGFMQDNDKCLWLKTVSLKSKEQVDECGTQQGDARAVKQT